MTHGIEEKLELRYVPLTQAKRWDENPKLHDIERLMHSIEIHGFGDPPKYDSQLEGLVYGNGRTEALERLRQEGKELPRGIARLDDDTWAIPVIFGCDAESGEAAVAFAIDHNNLTLQGGGLEFADLLAMWDDEKLPSVLGGIPRAHEVLVSLGEDEISELVDGPQFDPVSPEDQPRLGRKKKATCPECGHVFKP